MVEARRRRGRCSRAGPHRTTAGVARLASRRARERSALRAFDHLGPHWLRTAADRHDLVGTREHSAGDVLIETGYRFKGRCAPCVIFDEIAFDARDLQVERKRFVGMTRASMRVTLELPERADGAMLARLKPPPRAARCSRKHLRRRRACGRADNHRRPVTSWLHATQMNALLPKSASDRWLAPVTRRITISPHAITLASVAAMAMAAALLLAGPTHWAAPLVLLSGLLDVLDGAVARAHGWQSRFGALLDRVSDRVADALLLAALAIGGHVALALGVYALAVVPLASYVSACLEAATASSIGERLSQRAVRIVVLVVALALQEPATGVLLVASIGTWSLVSRLRVAWTLLR